MDHNRLILEVLEGNKVFCDVNASVLHSSNMDVMLKEIDATYYVKATHMDMYVSETRQ